MKLADLFPKKYLQAADLQGRAFTLTIQAIELRNMRTKETNQVTGEVKYTMTDKPVVFFVGRKAGVVLNKTRTQQLAEALGIEDTEQARGKSVTLYASGNQLMFRAAPKVEQKAPAPEVMSDAANPTD